MVKIVETPRDGFQGLSYLIDTQKKIEYINLLLQCGFHTVEVGSFVSPKVIPQMADTARVIEELDLKNTNSKIAVLVATESGGKMAMQFNQVDQIFFPFSISPTFLKKNINSSLQEVETTISKIQDQCIKYNKELVVYFSMGFDSAYGDNWSLELLFEWLSKFTKIGINIFPFSDILGEATPEMISNVFSNLLPEFPDSEFGFHLHSTAESRLQKIDAAYKSGVRRFDTVLNGLGGCPQTGKELVGNLPLSELTNYLENDNISTRISNTSIIQAEESLLDIMQ